MKLTILNVKSAKAKTVNKDLAGGYGTGTHIGESIRAKVIELLKRRGIKLPILAAGYIAAIFHDAGHQVEYRENEMPTDADLVLIPSSIVDCKNEIAWGKKVKEAIPSTKVGYFGAFASAQPQFYAPHGDLVIVGEPEAWAEQISSTGNIPSGLVTSPLIKEKDLDRIPYPKWDLFPVQTFSYSPVIKSKPFLTIQSSRGCVFSCSHYCPYTAMQGTKWRDRTVANVVGEIKYDVENFGVKGMLFRDPLFTFNKQRCSQIAQGIIDDGLDIEWGCETRLDLLNKELIDHLHTSGLRSINTGVESADPAICKSGKRLPVQIQQQEDIIRYCDKKGIRVSAFYIIGLGDDNEETVKKTMEYSQYLNTHIAQYTISTPYPGTPFFEEMKPHIFDMDFEHYDAYTPVWKHPNLTPEQMLALKEKAFVSYYFRPKYLMSFARRMLTT